MLSNCSQTCVHTSMAEKRMGVNLYSNGTWVRGYLFAIAVSCNISWLSSGWEAQKRGGTRPLEKTPAKPCMGDDWVLERIKIIPRIICQEAHRPETELYHVVRQLLRLPLHFARRHIILLFPTDLTVDQAFGNYSSHGAYMIASSGRSTVVKWVANSQRENNHSLVGLRPRFVLYQFDNSTRRWLLYPRKASYCIYGTRRCQSSLPIIRQQPSTSSPSFLSK